MTKEIIYTTSGYLSNCEDAEQMFEQLAYAFDVENKLSNDISLNNFTEGVQANYNFYGGILKGYLNSDLDIEACANHHAQEGSARLLLRTYDAEGDFLKYKELKVIGLKVEPLRQKEEVSNV